MRTRRARRGNDFDVRLLDGRRETVAYRVASGEEGMRLDRFLAKRLSWRSRTSATRLLTAGRVTLQGRSARRSRRVILGEIVTVALPRPRREEALFGQDMELPRLFEDEHLIAIDKPAGLPVHPAGRLLHRTVITALHNQYRNFDDPLRDLVPKLCHRLDLETSGVLLVAKNLRSLTFVQAQFERRTVRKDYLVLVHGAFEDETGVIDLPIGPCLNGSLQNRRAIRHDGGQPARTQWRVMQRWNGFTQLHVRLHTGRHHQIRVHMAAIGHPLVGEKVYGHDDTLFLRFSAGRMTAADRDQLRLPRQALHSHALAFEHPTRGPMRIESPWPPDLAAFCAGLDPA